MTSTPPWGTPVPGEPRARPEVGTAGDPDLAYVVLVEQTTGQGESMRWGLCWPPHGPGSLEQAREWARYLAYQHRPDHPMSEQTRAVFRIGDDGYLVHVEGMMKSFHFRISVAHRLPDVRPQPSTDR